MNARTSCGCLICNLERALLEEFCNAQHMTAYRNFTAGSAILSRFPTTSDLLQHLRQSEYAEDNGRESDAILGELLKLGECHSDEMSRRLLLVALMPAVHKTSRTIATRFSSLERDDIEQHLLTAILEILHSNTLRTRRSHFAFSITRSLRRNSFRWAIREANLASIEDDQDVGECAAVVSLDGGREATVHLRKFLRQCLRDGLLTDSEHEQLISFKVHEVPAERLAAREGMSKGAFRHRMFRLVERLRRAAKPQIRKDSMAASQVTKQTKASRARRNFAA